MYFFTVHGKMKMKKPKQRALDKGDQVYTIILFPFFYSLINYSTPVMFSHEHSDKKLLEEYDKDSNCVHRWLPIEFMNEKLN